MIRAVIFDLGGVVIRFTNERYYEHLSEVSGLPYVKVRDIEERELPLLEKGEITVRQFDRMIAKRLKIPLRKVMYYTFYVSHMSLNPDVLSLIKELRKEYTVAFLSNIDISRYGYTRKVLDTSLFRYRFTSCYLKMRKPDPRIYRAVLKSMKLKPEETVFIDDRLPNVKGARKVGMNAIHFRNRRSLDVELSKLL